MVYFIFTQIKIVKYETRKQKNPFFYFLQYVTINYTFTYLIQFRLNQLAFFSETAKKLEEGEMERKKQMKS